VVVLQIIIVIVNNNNNNNRSRKNSSGGMEWGLVENITTPAHCRNLMLAGPDPCILLYVSDKLL
jgi:hypothetical protein